MARGSIEPSGRLPRGRLHGNVVMVTGSTRGIGRAVAVQCAREGATVVVTGRTHDAGLEVEHEIQSLGGEAMFVPCDFTSEARVETAFHTVAERFGRLDGLVNNASSMDLYPKDGPITEITLEHWNELLTQYLTSCFLATKHGLRLMLTAEHGGSIVNISSMSGATGVEGLDAYTTAKGGMIALTRSVASYYSRYDVRCNCLVVGLIDTGTAGLAHLLDDPRHGPPIHQYYLGRIGRPIDVAMATIHLLSPESAFTTAAIIPVDGGATGTAHVGRGPRDLSGYRRLREF